MPIMEIKRYSPEYARQWDTAVDASRQGTFLFRRAYMDYHADRFEDFSLMAIEGNEVRGVLPANRAGDELISHGGLTYGGWATPAKGFDAGGVLRLWGEMNCFLAERGIKRVLYKPVPWFYADVPAEEDMYALFRCGARLETCQVSSVINLHSQVGFDSNARRNERKGVQSGITVADSDDLDTFWEILDGVLTQRYGKHPVHTVGEMRLLARRFPMNIRLKAAFSSGGEMLAGVVMYYSRRVAHAQYIAASPKGKVAGALPVLFGVLIADACDKGYSFFDFGISCERGGEFLNEGLLRQKSGFGGRGVNYTSWSFDPRKFPLPD